MTMRLSDADALKKDVARLHVLNDEAEIRRAYEYNPHVTSTDFEETLVSVFDAIDEAPSIDIEPKRGEWICHEGRWIDFDYYPTKYECNQCHHYVDVASDKNFCPNCGADMRKESE